MDYSSDCDSAKICSNGGCVAPPEEHAGQYAAINGCTDFLNDLLIANRIQISCQSALLRFGARFSTAAGQVRFALYDDAGGLPGKIVAGSNPVAVVSGNVEATASAAVLNPGNYWVVMNISSTAACPTVDAQAAANSMRYADFQFGNPSFPPTVFPRSMGLPNLFNLYITIRKNP